jgi:hypothetical protein
MALKATVASLDDIAAEFQPLYTQKGDVFVLEIEGIDTHPELAPLKNAYERQKTDNATLRQERDTARTELANATKGKPDEAALLAERNSYETKIAELTGKLDEANGKLTGMTRDTALKTALADAGITNPAFLKAATMLHREAIKMDGDNAVVDGPMGPKPLADFIKNWVAGDEGKAFVTQPKGGGAEGGKSGGQKPLSEMGDAERLELARQGKLKAPAA